jgi:hypothetical protein
MTRFIRAGIGAGWLLLGVAGAGAQTLTVADLQVETVASRLSGPPLMAFVGEPGDGRLVTQGRERSHYEEAVAFRLISSCEAAAAAE